MDEPALLFTDLEGSTALVERLGDAQAAAMWAEHDRCGRDLIAAHGGHEIDHTDGFFALFPVAQDAAAFALGYQAALSLLGLSARVGIHCGAVTLRHNGADDVARGAKPVEVEGLAKPLAARVMAHARGGQILITAAARAALGAQLPQGAAVESHGHYRLKGIADPIELFELGNAASGAFAPPPDSEKVYRVVRSEAEGFWRPLREVRHNLAAERDAFVGRTVELHALARRLDDGARLVSVLGAGGCGKTRLVRRYAWAWLGDWPGGVVFADLSEARSLEGILGAVAAALDVPLSSTAPAQQLGHAIAARGRCLFVLDNFEQVLAHAQATLGVWLALAGAASFVVTSRERLHLQGEEILALEPLALAEEAVELFAVRARAQLAGFEVSDANRAAVERIVALLDGLPLAIELAAARVRVLAPAQLVERLRDRFALLAGARGSAARQATLRAAIDWSWDLLTLWEQAALAQCSAFEGGFTLDAAERVLDLSAWPEAPPLLDAVQALVDKSLLRSWLPAARDRYGFDEPYFGMYVSIHEYARERLAGLGADAAAAAQLRHGHHFAGLGSDAAIEALFGAAGTQARHALGLELDNLVAACRRAAARADAATALATYRACWEALDLRGPFSLGIDLGALVLGMQELAPAQRALALSVRARAAQRAGRMAESTTWLRESLALARAAGDRRVEASARGNLGTALRSAGEIEAARGEYEAALEIQRELGNRRAQGTVLTGLGVLRGESGDVKAAHALYARALAIQRELGNRIDEANLLNLVAVLHAESGDLVQARSCFEEALAISEALGDRVAAGELLTNLGTIALEQGRADEGADSYRRALAMHREVGNRRFEGYVQGDMGRMHLERQQPELARPCLEQALAIARETGERRQQGATLRSLGELFMATGQHAACAAAYAEAEALLRAVSDKHYLAKVLCGRAELARLGANFGKARELLTQARELAEQIHAGPQSQLGQALDTLAAALA